jgi:hypothetical protein
MSVEGSAPTTTGRHHITGAEELRAAAQELLSSARHRLEIFAPRFELKAFHDHTATEILNHFATRDQRNRGQFIITDEAWFLRFNSRIVDLCRRLSSFYEIRKLAAEYPFEQECFIVVDRESVFHQPELTERVAITSVGDRGYAGQFVRKIEAYWNASEPLQELFTLGL